MMLSMLGTFAEYERDLIIERTRVGMEKKAKTGRFVGGSVPFGYELVPDVGLKVNAGEATVVRKIFEHYAAGDGVYTLCRTLNAAGYRNRRGGKWDRRTILHMLRNDVYRGKIRWRGARDGTHEAIVSAELFEKVANVLGGRAENLKGRQWHVHDSRFLTGVIHCVKCGGPMVGVSGFKDGRKVPYYACTKRMRTKDCDQAYVRADVLENGIIEDIKAMLRNEQFLEQVWTEANRLLSQEKPEIEKELAVVEAQSVVARQRRDKYFAAFETGQLSPKACDEKLAEINAQLDALNASRANLDARRASLEIVPLTGELLAALIEDFDRVLAAGTNEQKKHLLHRMVKEVRVHERTSVEIHYAVPNLEDHEVRTQPQLARLVGQCANRMPRPGTGLRVRVWRALRPRRGRLSATLVEPTVLAGAGRAAHLHDWLASLPRRMPRPANRAGLVWRALLAAGVFRNRAALARWRGVSRARVTQILRRG
jgi:site-specific DNA recombinase